MEPEHHSNDPQLDALLDRLAESTPVPEGLADRVFEASVRRLPGAAPLEFGAQPTRRIHVATWGRIAIAVAIVVACLIGVRLMLLSSSPGTPDSEKIAGGEAGGSVVQVARVSDESYERVLMGGRNLAWSDEEASPFERGELDYLLDTRHASHADVLNEVDDVISMLDS